MEKKDIKMDYESIWNMLKKVSWPVWCLVYSFLMVIIFIIPIIGIYKFIFIFGLITALFSTIVGLVGLIERYG